jgi:hypothetical protein
VRLTRADAMKFAAAVLRTTGDTFHYHRCGQLRPAEAAELLQALREIEVELDEIREHALADLLDGTGLGDDQPEPERASSDDLSATGAPDTKPAATEPAEAEAPAPREAQLTTALPLAEQFTDAISSMFADVQPDLTSSEAFGALRYKVISRCQETGETPKQVLTTISVDDRMFAISRANDPAAFLASRINS